MSEYGPYGRVALAAAKSLSANSALHPAKTWEAAARHEFPISPSSREKGCPRTAFLTLCGTGLIAGIPSGEYCERTTNWEHALAGLAIAASESDHTPTSLWKRVTNGSGKAHNRQMHVLLALVRSGLLTPRRVPSLAPRSATSQNTLLL